MSSNEEDTPDHLVAVRAIRDKAKFIMLLKKHAYKKARISSPGVRQALVDIKKRLENNLKEDIEMCDKALKDLDEIRYALDDAFH